LKDFQQLVIMHFDQELLKVADLHRQHSGPVA
jgi:hypothetical protein